MSPSLGDSLAVLAFVQTAPGCPLRRRRASVEHWGHGATAKPSAGRRGGGIDHCQHRRSDRFGQVVPGFNQTPQAGVCRGRFWKSAATIPATTLRVEPEVVGVEGVVQNACRIANPVYGVFPVPGVRISLSPLCCPFPNGEGVSLTYSSQLTSALATCKGYTFARLQMSAADVAVAVPCRAVRRRSRTAVERGAQHASTREAPVPVALTLCRVARLRSSPATAAVACGPIVARPPHWTGRATLQAQALATAGRPHRS